MIFPKDLPKVLILAFLGCYVALGILSVFAAVYLFPWGLGIAGLGFLGLALSIYWNMYRAKELAEERD